MAYSVEHSNNFHMARRIVKVIAPEFRVFATTELSQGHSVLDLDKKTIEVPESVNDIETVALILFQLGHLNLRNNKEFAEHFGKVEDIGAKRLVSRLSKQGAKADQLAASWSMEVLEGVFSVAHNQAEKMILSQVWDESEWREYFSEMVPFNI